MILYLIINLLLLIVNFNDKVLTMTIFTFLNSLINFIYLYHHQNQKPLLYFIFLFNFLYYFNCYLNNKITILISLTIILFLYLYNIFKYHHSYLSISMFLFFLNNILVYQSIYNSQLSIIINFLSMFLVLLTSLNINIFQTIKKQIFLFKYKPNIKNYLNPINKTIYIGNHLDLLDYNLISIIIPNIYQIKNKKDYKKIFQYSLINLFAEGKVNKTDYLLLDFKYDLNNLPKDYHIIPYAITGNYEYHDITIEFGPRINSNTKSDLNLKVYKEIKKLIRKNINKNELKIKK